MVSTIEKQMPPRHLQHCIEEEKENRETLNIYEAHQKILAEKSITRVQVCLRCGRKLPFKKGRRSCPYCQCSLRTETIVLKVL